MAKILNFPSVWEPHNPDSLLDICIKYCVLNLQTLCEYDPVKREYKLHEGINLPTGICERLLKIYSDDLDKIVDDSFLKIFQNTSATRLQRVDLRDTEVSDEGLELILRHPVVDLDISGCSKLTGRTVDIINVMKSDLLSLTVGNAVQIFPESLYNNACMDCDFVDHVSVYVQKGYILRTPNLRKLIVRGLEVPLEKEYFPLLLYPLVNLTYLDLSNCCHVRDLSYLTAAKNLMVLILFNVPRLQEAVPIISQMKMLRHLDLSQSNEKHGHYKHPNQVLQQMVDSLPSLMFLDISGTNLAGSGSLGRDSPYEMSPGKEERTFDQSPTDIPGLKNRVNNPLEFLGLFGTAHEACYRRFIPAKKVAGDANEEQILTAAQVYYDRPEILQKVLNDLFHVFRYESCNYPRLALDVIMVAMKRHLHEKHIQIAGSASLFYIVKGEEKNNFNIKIKRRIIKALLDGMCTHRSDTTMLRNGCLTLIHFKIPQDVLFDYERLVDILLHIVHQKDQEDFVQRIGIYLLNSLACQVEGMQKQLVGDKGAITIMLKIIEARLLRLVADEVMETAWSTMWNVTDETPINCQRFLDEGGMNLFLGCLKTFPDKPELLRNMMGLLGNVAEVKDLRPRLMKDDYLQVFSDLLDSSSDGIEVSYNAAGILSHIACDGPELWADHGIQSVHRDKMLERMVNAIERWKLDTKRNINYRSFEPILRLLNVHHTPQAQHWAVWALANLTHVYPDKYCPLIQEEGGIELLQDLVANNKPYKQIRDLAIIILNQCTNFKKSKDEGMYEDAS